MSISSMILVAASLHALPGTDSARSPVPGDLASRSASHALTPANEVGMSATALSHAEEEVWNDMQRGAFPGAALAIGRNSKVVLEDGFGTLGRGGLGDEVDPDRSVYDLASLTKVVGTTTAVMLLVEDGKMRLDEPVAAYLPEFTGGGRERVTIRHLLTHTSGLPDGIDVPGGMTPEQGLRYVLGTPLRSSPGMRVEYSDLGFVILFAAAERAAGEPLYHFLDRRVFGPLRMRSTTYWPGEGCGRCAPTSREMGIGFRGHVHDPIARRLGGIAGNAGLFSTAHDLARFAAMMANGGELDGVRVLQRATIRMFTQRQPGTGTRALGWDTPGRLGTNMFGNRVSDRSFGHTGYTGTSIWIDPDLGTWVVLLANRTYDTEGNNRMQALRRAVADHVVAAAQFGGMVASGGGN
ncbi:serine hydrolase domain-containing protein [Longimicrobium sp.]|uniref:serine hydrolase domain-containing protein n=1 Tax=Longimicrobium sp. TaxID=2029185 RepID=UPI002C2736E9|nr:serine hydrolase domain-containing protein [Longimicrobium sp.]HSU16016.1 serine hydrolase domain-containing protein [Longimicrobium sp.]